MSSKLERQFTRFVDGVDRRPDTFVHALLAHPMNQTYVQIAAAGKPSEGGSQFVSGIDATTTA